MRPPAAAQGNTAASRSRPTSTDRSSDKKQSAKSSEEERRKGHRRGKAGFVRLLPRTRAGAPQAIVPCDWGWFAVFIAVASVLGMAVSMSLPPLSSAVASGAGIAFAWHGRGLARTERATRSDNDGSIPKWMCAWCWLSLVVPAACVALTFTAWAAFGDMEIQWALGAIITSNVLAASLLASRILQQFAVQFACWMTVVVFEGSIASYAAMAVATGSTLLIVRHQLVLARRRAEEQEARERVSNRAEDILRDYEETGQGWFWETDRRGMLTYISSPVAQTLGTTAEALIQCPFVELFELGDDNHDGERTLTFHMSSRSSFQELGVKANIKGEERWWSVSGRPAYDSFGNFLGFRGSGTDLTEKKRNEESVQRLAQYDSLTSLANRFQMLQLLDKILSAPMESQRECSVMLLDLDRFKQVNDTLGHPAGDALLQQVAKRLERTVDTQGRVGRLGGDEFEVIVPGRWKQDDLARLAQDIINSLSQPYSVDGHRVTIGASLGIAIAPDNGTDSEHVIRNADLALYAAKDGGRGRYHFFSLDLHSVAEQKAVMEDDLRDAVANKAFQLFYQPIVAAKGNRIIGFEALLRWEHPEKGWVSPDKFIPVAEDTGLIAAIGEWAINTACNDLAQFPGDVKCAVNVSPLQFSNPQLPGIVTNAIMEAGIRPERLELEITESVFLNDDAGTEAMFAALKKVGVRLALDDFGTGYSSLGYLKKAPFDKIKIDQSFVRGATQPGNRNGAIITSITSLAESLGMDTTAEGVETMDELELVRSLGCSQIQGYIFSKAVPFTKAVALLGQGPTIEADGFRSARSTRQTMLRKVMLEHDGQFYKATIRNMSPEGALVEGLYKVPPGTQFNLAISADIVTRITCVWSNDRKMGVTFARPLDTDNSGTIVLRTEERDNPAIVRAAHSEAA
ncbi:MAG: EAL domain-containing protein [Parerythrobacter sp.]